MNTRLERLIELNDRTNDLVEFKLLRELTEEERLAIEQGRAQADEINNRVMGSRITHTAVGAGAVGAGFLGQRAVTRAGGYGAVAGKIRTRVQPMVTAARDRVTTAVPRVKAAASAMGPAYFKGGMREAAKPGATLLKIAKRGILSAAKAARYARFESREQRLIQLHSKADQLLQLEAR